jgi:hypothetical protein
MLPGSVLGVERGPESQSHWHVTLQMFAEPHPIEHHASPERQNGGGAGFEEPRLVIAAVPPERDAEPLDQLVNQGSIGFYVGNGDAVGAVDGEVDADDRVALVVLAERCFVLTARVRGFDVDHAPDRVGILSDLQQNPFHVLAEPLDRRIDDRADRIGLVAAGGDFSSDLEIEAGHLEEIVAALLELGRVKAANDVLTTFQLRHGAVEVLDGEVLRGQLP